LNGKRSWLLLITAEAGGHELLQPLSELERAGLLLILRSNRGRKCRDRLLILGSRTRSAGAEGFSALVSARDGYVVALKRVPLAANTRRAHAAVAGFLEWLGGWDVDRADPLADPHARDFAVRDYKAHLKAARHGPATVNACA
jgi:hypothetical protein